MGRGKKKKKRRGHYQPVEKKRSVGATTSERLIQAGQHEDAEKQRDAEVHAFKEQKRNPYVWNGDVLVHRKDGRVVAHASEFPELHRAREHYRRLDVMRLFHKGHPPYFHENTNPEIEVAHG